MMSACNMISVVRAACDRATEFNLPLWSKPAVVRTAIISCCSIVNNKVNEKFSVHPMIYRIHCIRWQSRDQSNSNCTHILECMALKNRWATHTAWVILTIITFDVTSVDELSITSFAKVNAQRAWKRNRAEFSGAAALVLLHQFCSPRKLDQLVAYITWILALNLTSIAFVKKLLAVTVMNKQSD